MEQLPELSVSAGAAALLTKILVDAVQLAWQDRPDYVPILLAFPAGFVFSVVLLVAQGDVLTSTLYAQSVIVAMVAGGAAIGVTKLNNVRKERTDARKEDS